MLDKWVEKGDPLVCMSNCNRQMPRYPDFARACLPELCQLPGYMEDVSKIGCRVRFSHNFDIDCEREYSLKILPALRSGIKEFELMVKPIWVQENDDSCEIGFTVVHSPGIRLFTRYVEILAELEEEEIQEA